jgi:hypothetical protein
VTIPFKLEDATMASHAVRIGSCARAGLLALLIALGLFGVSRESRADAAVSAAAAVANGGLSACASSAGKALYECIANVLDKLSNDITSSSKVPATRSALSTAAAELRAAANKVQALSAIARCRALISGALAQVRAIGGAYVPGWGGGSGGGAGLAAIAGVLARATKLIQAKG